MKPGSRTFEDIGVHFLMRHAGKVWAALALIAAWVVLVRERLI
jgi:hypothetical protein